MQYANIWAQGKRFTHSLNNLKKTTVGRQLVIRLKKTVSYSTILLEVTPVQKL